jgi:hypothetical protein
METYVDSYGQGGVARQDRKMDGRNSLLTNPDEPFIAQGEKEISSGKNT